MKIFLKALAILSAVIFASCSGSKGSADLGFAKNTFESLTRGDTAVIANIDWETFTSLGIPVGPQYLALETVEDKEAFKNGFVTQFSATFRDSGGSVNDFTNWRVIRTDENFTEVAADSAKGSLHLTVSERDSVKRLSALKIRTGDS